MTDEQQKPETFDLTELMSEAQSEAIRREHVYEIAMAMHGPSAREERGIRIWSAIARALELASYDTECFREFCRHVADGRWRGQFLDFCRKYRDQQRRAQQYRRRA